MYACGTDDGVGIGDAPTPPAIGVGNGGDGGGTGKGGDSTAGSEAGVPIEAALHARGRGDPVGGGGSGKDMCINRDSLKSTQLACTTDGSHITLSHKGRNSNRRNTIRNESQFRRNIRCCEQYKYNILFSIR